LNIFVLSSQISPLNIRMVLAWDRHFPEDYREWKKLGKFDSKKEYIDKTGIRLFKQFNEKRFSSLNWR
ncbi:MAG: hypothetical protein JSV51_09405, partial [Candidatus Bathyarchaeota archaeon]